MTTTHFLNAAAETAGVDADSAPLTGVQQGMLVSGLGYPAQGFEFEQLQWEIQGPLQVDCLARAWELVYQRHDALNLEVHWRGRELPEQRVSHTQPRLALEVVEDTDLQQRAHTLKGFLTRDRRLAPAADQPPLSRLTLLRFAEDDHVLVWSFLHLILDGRSIAQVLDEVAQAYLALCRQQTPELPPASSFLRHARQRYTQTTVDPDFWRDYLQGFQQPNPLPTDPSATADREQRGYCASLQLPEDLSGQLQQAAANLGISLNNLLQGAWAQVLANQTSDDDLVFGNIRSCRHGIQATACGMFMNLLPLRVQLRPGATPRQILEQVREAQQQMRTRELTPLQEISGLLDINTESPLFATLLVYDRDPVWGRAAQRLGPGHRFVLHEQPRWPVSVSVTGTDQLQIRLMVDTDRLSPGYAERLTRQLERALELYARAPDTPLTALDWLPLSERDATVHRLNATTRDLPHRTTLHALAQASALANPAAPAVITARGSHSYRELDAYANRIARQLQQWGVVAGSRVAVRVERGFELAAALLGAMKAGAAYVPLDMAWPPERVQAIVTAVEPAAVITCSTGAETPLLAGRTLDLRQAASALDALPDTPVESATTPDDLAYIIFTSGSTGQPKGVMVSHAAAANTVLDCNERFAVSTSDRIFGISSCAFDLSVYDYFGAFAAGAAVVICPAAATRDPGVWRQLIAAHRVTLWNSVPALAEMLIEGLTGAAPQLQSLRLVMMSGDWIPLDLPSRLRETLPAAELYSLGGATEAAIWSIIHPITTLNPRLHSIPYGRPMANQSWYVLDPELRPCPTLVAGDLYIGGVGLARGYWRDPERTGKAFIQHPEFGPLYRTGDRGRHLGDGTLEFLGRVDNQVKLHGYRIELGEIESLASQLPWVQRCVTAVRHGDRGQPWLAAWVLCDGDGFDPQALLQHWQARLPEYMIPRTLQPISQLPLSANGKVDLGALPDPAPNDPTGAPTTTVDPHQWHPWEQRLAGLWERLLGQYPAGPESSFFDYGGNSLLALRLVALVEKEFGRQVPPGAVFEFPGLRQFRLMLERDRMVDELLIPLQTQGHRPAFFLIAEYFDIGRHMTPDQPLYGIPLGASILLEQPELDYPALARLCLKAMRRVAPEGPYYLGGHCFGAVVAFQVAMELQRLGEAVNYLALLDPPVPAGIDAPPQDPLDRLRYHWHRSRHLGPVGALPYLTRSLGNLFGQWWKAARGLAPGRVLAAFTPETLAVNTHMILAQHGYYRFKPDQDPRLAWGQWCGELTVNDSPGDHVTFCREPQVQALARYLCQALAEVEATGPAPLPELDGEAPAPQ
ncbi:MAG: hypothetical protein CML06_06560 [Pseudomonadales bacterium]|nr:hypothetical protein [Pseudomonadales bacterium]